MDLFTGPVGTGQVHDFNPGIRKSGLFWTQPVSQDVLDVDLEDGTATLKVTDLDEEDYHNLHNALLDGPSEPASVSFKMRWTATAPAIRVTDATHGFTGRFRISTVKIEWTAQSPTFEFVSDAANTTINVASVIGRERSGVFFSPNSAGDDLPGAPGGLNEAQACATAAASSCPGWTVDELKRNTVTATQ